MQKILCVCLGNRSRSPMMQALLQKLLGNAFRVESAGIRKEAAGLPANDRSILLMRERDTDLTNHRSRWIGDLDLTQYSHIICVGENEFDQVRKHLGESSRTVVLIANGDSVGIPDPYEKGLSGYRECLALLDDTMPKIARQIR